MPLRPSASPYFDGEEDLLRLYRTINYGDLALFAALDTRDYRKEPAEPEAEPGSEEVQDPKAENTLIGREQETWLFETLDSSEARWNVIAQQIGMFDYASGRRGDIVGWDGHGYARDRILRHLDGARPSNPVVITGDLHCSWVSDLKADFSDESSDTVGTEFVGTSVTSGLGESYARAYERHLEQNPHVRFFDERTGGYVRCEVTPEEWRTEMKLADSIEDPDSPVHTFASFVIEDGQPEAKQA